MTDTAPDRSARPVSFWSKVPGYWKFVTVLIAIGGVSISAYATLDNERDALNDRINQLEAAVQAGDAELGRRIDDVAAAMVRRSDLSEFIPEEQLRAENCRQTLRAQRHEFQALYKAYEELISAIRLAEKSFANRLLSSLEERQEDEVIELRSGFQARRLLVERELKALDIRINLEGGC